MSMQADKLRWISVGYIQRAKRWFVWFWTVQVIAVGVNALGAWGEMPPIWGAVAGFVLAASSELIRWRSDALRSNGELFKRRLEFCEGFSNSDYSTEIADDQAGGGYDIKQAILLEG